MVIYQQGLRVEGPTFDGCNKSQSNTAEDNTKCQLMFSTITEG